MRWLLTVFLVAVLLRVLAQLVLGPYASPQTWEYEDIANSLLAGQAYTDTIGQTTYVAAVSSPLYVLLSAGVSS